MKRRWLLALLALSWAFPVSAEPLSLGQYRDAVAGLEAAIAAGDLAALQAGARPLLAADAVVDLESGPLVPDPSLFRPLLQAASIDDARFLSPRLGALRRALDGFEDSGSLAVDRELLDRLTAANAEQRPVGEGFTIADDGGLLQALGDLLRPVRDFLSKVWREFSEWLADLFRRKTTEGGWLAGLPLPGLVTVLVGVFALALAFLAVRAWRDRARRGPSAAAAVAAPPAADDDPLSRDQGGWRRYARELATAGRTREAIRAWYHAVLVALYGQGLVTYRKGRTNWELVSALSPALGFRPNLVEFTRLFDREWYGLRQSPPEALSVAEGLAEDLLASIEPAGRTP